MIGLADERAWVTLPIESNVRELDAKTLLAAVLAERGAGAILTRISDSGRVLPRIPASVVLQKDVVGTALVELARQRGHSVASMDEEGLVQRDPQDYLHRRVSVPALQASRRFFAWGDVHRSVILTKAPELAPRVISAGNPRADLLRPELRQVYGAAADALQDRIGPFVMVNTNFGSANHRLGGDYLRNHWATGGWSSGEERGALLERITTFQQALLEAFVDLVDRLANQLGPTARVVVRPHPSERHDTWRHRLADHDNVMVCHEGSVVPWLLAAQAVVHNGCTTGVESALLERPTYAYMPVRDEPVESPLPNLVSRQLASPDEVIDAVLGALGGARATPEDAHREVLTAHIANLEGPLASEVIAAHLCDVAPSAAGFRGTSTLPGRIRLGRVLLRARSYASATHARTLSQQRAYDALLRQTSPGLSAVAVTGFLDRLRRATGRFGDVECVAVAPEVLVIASRS